VILAIRQMVSPWSPADLRKQRDDLKSEVLGQTKNPFPSPPSRAFRR